MGPRLLRSCGTGSILQMACDPSLHFREALEVKYCGCQLVQRIMRQLLDANSKLLREGTKSVLKLANLNSDHPFRNPFMH